MKKIFFLFFLAVISGCVIMLPPKGENSAADRYGETVAPEQYATGIRPDQQPLIDNPTAANFEFYSQKNGTPLRRANLDSVGINYRPGIISIDSSETGGKNAFFYLSDSSQIVFRDWYGTEVQFQASTAGVNIYNTSDTITENRRAGVDGSAMFWELINGGEFNVTSYSGFSTNPNMSIGPLSSSIGGGNNALTLYADGFGGIEFIIGEGNAYIYDATRSAKKGLEYQNSSLGADFTDGTLIHRAYAAQMISDSLAGGGTVTTDGTTILGDGSPSSPLEWSGAFVSGPVTGSGFSAFPLTLLNSSITNGYLGASAVSSDKIRDTSIVTVDLKDAAVTFAKIAQDGAATDEIISWAGSAWDSRPTEQITTYDAPGGYTYNIPSWAKSLEVLAIGSGGGGGGGRRGAAGSIRCGGGGGGGGGMVVHTFQVTDFSGATTVSCVVAAGGVGGDGRTTDNATGVAGGSGAASTISVSGKIIMQGSLGGSGAGGSATSGTGGNSSVSTMFQGSAGASASTSGAAGSNAGQANAGCSGGGSGGGITTVDAASGGGSGGTWIYGARTNANGGSTGGNGGNGEAITAGTLQGQGGGGGGSSVSGVGGNGGAGVRGGGGGGGGAAANGNNSGAGGNGGDGYIRIIARG